jgi:periplasmic protein TonB
MIPVNDSKLAFSLIASCLIHAIVMILAPTAFKNDSTRRHRDMIPVGLLELSPAKQETASRQEEKPNPVKKPALAAPKPKLPKPERAEPVAKKPPAEQAPPLGVKSPPTEQTVKSPESHPALPVDPVPHYSTAPSPGGGSEAGAGNLLGQGEESGVIPGSGMGGGGGTASLGLGRGSGTPGAAAPTTPVHINREAKPMQTVRATYPPMALRMGLEGDVTLRISIDSEGNVTDAEIIKSGGAGFDDEALKAVRQARFEPAQNEGRNVPAVFTYVYHFRLRK